MMEKDVIIEAIKGKLEKTGFNVIEEDVKVLTRTTIYSYEEIKLAKTVLQSMTRQLKLDPSFPEKTLPHILDLAAFSNVRPGQAAADMFDVLFKQYKKEGKLKWRTT
jgi:hypothetical protein